MLSYLFDSLYVTPIKIFFVMFPIEWDLLQGTIPNKYSPCSVWYDVKSTTNAILEGKEMFKSAKLKERRLIVVSTAFTTKSKQA